MADEPPYSSGSAVSPDAAFVTGADVTSFPRSAHRIIQFVLVVVLAAVVVGVVPAGRATAAPVAADSRKGPLSLPVSIAELGRIERGHSRTTHLPVVNTSGARVVVGAFSFRTYSSWLKVTTDCEGQSLAPGAACDLVATATVRFNGRVGSSGTVMHFGKQELRPVFVVLGYSTLQLTPRQLTPPTTFLGDEPTSQEVTLTNLGTRRRTITAQQAPAAPFATTGSCVGRLDVGATCRVQVVYQPTRAGGFSPTALSFTADDGEVLTVAIDQAAQSGESSALQPFVLSARTLDFGQVPIGRTSAEQSVTVTNVSRTTRTVTGRFAQVPRFGGDTDCENTELAPGASCTMTFAFQASATGRRSATASGKWGPLRWEVLLRGEGVSAAPTTALSISPTTLDFGDVRAGETRSREVTVRNQTARPVTLHGGPDHHLFFISSGTCADGLVLSAGAACSMVFTVTPDNSGNLIVSIDAITGAWSAQPFKIIIVAGESLRLLRLSSKTLDFGFGAANATRPVQVVTVTNEGVTPTTIDNTPFDVSSGLAVSDGCRGRTLPVGGSCPVTVSWPTAPDPTLQGPAVEADASVVWNGSEIDIRAVGTSVAPTRVVAFRAQFGTVALGSSRRIELAVVNDDVIPHSVTATLSVTNPEVTVTTTCDGSVRPAGGGCVIAAVWSPTSTSFWPPAIITGTVGRYSVSIPLSGTPV